MLDEHGNYESADLTGPKKSSSDTESQRVWRGIDPGNRCWSVPRTGRYAEFIEANFISNYRKVKSIHKRLDLLDDAGLIHWTNKGTPRLKRYLRPNAGMPPQSIWDDISKAGGEEDEGYDTQKPVALLDRIIKASSKKGDIVLDPFCGCGTTLEAAHREGRQWIGIDIAFHAIKRVSAVRLKEKCKLIEGQAYEIHGIPRTLEAATDLWTRDPYQFQKWIVEMVDGFVTARKTNDGEVDGRIYFPEGEDLKAMKLSVKGGENINPGMLRALAGVIDNEGYPMGGFITRKTLGTQQKANFLKFCREKGFVEINGVSYPRLQMLCVEEILDGKRFNTPMVRGKSKTNQMSLFHA